MAERQLKCSSHMRCTEGPAPEGDGASDVT